MHAPVRAVGRVRRPSLVVCADAPRGVVSQTDVVARRCSITAKNVHRIGNSRGHDHRPSKEHAGGSAPQVFEERRRTAGRNVAVLASASGCELFEFRQGKPAFAAEGVLAGLPRSAFATRRRSGCFGATDFAREGARWLAETKLARRASECWRRRESNPRPRIRSRRNLHAYPLLKFRPRRGRTARNRPTSPDEISPSPVGTASEG